MPAYRSEAEAEVRRDVVDRLRILIPGCRIINEINAASFGNRIDVLAVGTDKMVAVEIKSEKDKLDRLPDQIKAMRSVTPYVISALHERFFSINSNYGRRTDPEQSRGSHCWLYSKESSYDDWELFPPYRRVKIPKSLPSGALGMLWREELHSICHGLNMKGVAKLTMDQAADEIRYRLTGAEINAHVFRTLRARTCVEADDAIRT